MRTREEIQNDIADLVAEQNASQKAMDDYEINPDDDTIINLYNEMLDECGTVKIGSLEYSPSDVLKSVDPTAYRCGLLDFIDSLDNEDFGDYCGMIEAYGERKDQIDELETELEELDD